MLEGAVPDPRLKAGDQRQARSASLAAILELFERFWEWLDRWWHEQEAAAAASAAAAPRTPSGSAASTQVAGGAAAGAAAGGGVPADVVAFKHEAWIMLVGVLCKLSANFSPVVRQSAVSLLQRVGVGGEGLMVHGDYVAEALGAKALPLMGDLLKMSQGARGVPLQEVDATLMDLVRAIMRMVIIYMPHLEAQPGFVPMWRQLLEYLMACSTGHTEVLTEGACVHVFCWWC